MLSPLIFFAGLGVAGTLLIPRLAVFLVSDSVHFEVTCNKLAALATKSDQRLLLPSPLDIKLSHVLVASTLKLFRKTSKELKM